MRIATIIFIVLIFAQCKNIVKEPTGHPVFVLKDVGLGIASFPIDDSPIVKIDTSLLGIWKADEDTNKANFFFIQNSDDVLVVAEKWFYLDTNEKRSHLEKIFAQRMNVIRDSFPGNQTLIRNEEERSKECFQQDLHLSKEDTVKFLADCEKLRHEKNTYYITYFSNSGTNPQYNQFHMMLSEIEKSRFLNVSYHNVPAGGSLKDAIEGYFFVKIIDIDSKFSSLTTSIVCDSALYNLKNSVAVRHRIENNINNSSFYIDTLHFHKINHTHAIDQAEAIKLANP